MKKTLVSMIVGAVVTASTISASAQGYIVLDNYNANPGNPPLVTHGPGSGGTTGSPVGAPGWNIGIYYALGNVSVLPDPTGIADPASLGPLLLGSGPGSSVGLGSLAPGLFLGDTPFGVPGAAAGSLVTCMVVAFNGADYMSSMVRGHSSAFTVTALANTAIPPATVGVAMPSFSVVVVPEPSTFALAGLGSLALLAFRRRSV